MGGYRRSLAADRREVEGVLRDLVLVRDDLAAEPQVERHTFAEFRKVRSVFEEVAAS